jgi:hypothetical protein
LVTRRRCLANLARSVGLLVESRAVEILSGLVELLAFDDGARRS